MQKVRFAAIATTVLAMLILVGKQIVHDFFFFVPSRSMAPTIEAGDVIFCAPDSTIERGDVVAFHVPSFEMVGLKRVVGVKGDTLSYERRTLTINGRRAARAVVKDLDASFPEDELVEENLNGRRYLTFATFGPPEPPSHIEIDDGYFVLGDNRDKSFDSRRFGEIATRDVMCRALAIVISQTGGGFSLARSGRIDAGRGTAEVTTTRRQPLVR